MICYRSVPHVLSSPCTHKDSPIIADGSSLTAQVDTARKERSDLEKASTHGAGKLKELDAQRATLIKTHAKDRQTWQTKLGAAQAAEKEARAEAAKATARAAELEAKLKGGAIGGKSACDLACKSRSQLQVFCLLANSPLHPARPVRPPGRRTHYNP